MTSYKVIASMPGGREGYPLASDVESAVRTELRHAGLVALSVEGPQVLWQTLAGGYGETVVTVLVKTDMPLDGQGHRTLVGVVDRSLVQLGQRAIRVVITQVLDYLVHGLIAGAVGGGAVGSTSAESDHNRGAAGFFGSLLGALLGMVVGANLHRDRVVVTDHKDAMGTWH